MAGPGPPHSVALQLVERCEARLGPASAAFARRVFSMDVETYAARLAQYGFVDRGAVLDAGCGFGQWSLALATTNATVEACDIREDRVDFLRELAGLAKAPNLRATRADLAALPHPDASFDAVFCYGALFLTPWRASLGELVRVLRPGGILYVNANGLGWYKHLWTTQHNRSVGYEPRLQVARAFLNPWRYDQGEPTEPGVDVLIDPKDLHVALARGGLENVTQADEGCLGATDLPAARSRAFFEGTYGGDLGVYEVIASKRSSSWSSLEP